MTFLLGGVYIELKDVVRILCIFISIFFYINLLYTGLVNILLHTLYFIFIYDDDVCFFLTYLYMCFFFSIFIHMFLYVCNSYFYFTHDALMSFV